MALILKVKVDRIGNKTARWLYLPKMLYQLLGEPYAFKVEVYGNKLVLHPISDRDYIKIEEKPSSTEESILKNYKV